MDYKVFTAEYKGLTFVIKEDLPEVGVYLFIYKDDNCIKDILQDTINICKEVALEEFGVPIEIWKES